VLKVFSKLPKYVMAQKLKKTWILCVDDEKIVADSIEDQIRNHFGLRLDVELAQGGEEALEILQEMKRKGQYPALIISDQVMPGMKGDQFLIHAHQIFPDTTKVLMTGYTSFEAIQNIINQASLFRYIPKPWEEMDLIIMVEKALKQFNQTQQLAAYSIYTRLLQSLHTAVQQLSREMDLQILVDKFLQIAIECTDAQRGILILKDQTQQMKVQALATGGATGNNVRAFAAEEVEVLTSFIMENIDLLLEIDAINPQQLAAKLAHKEVVWGYIYLEQGRDKKTFMSYHREVLEMLASQAAIAIENAHLYQGTKEQAAALSEEKHKVESANALLEEQNADITDSIRYAKRIQQAILPPRDQLMQYFPHSFILLKPKDILSGDFYWWRAIDSVLLLAAADCTGHGVPGAMMSIIGATFFHRFSTPDQFTSVEQLLEDIDQAVRESLNQTGGIERDDGMDLALCAINYHTRELYFAGANRPLYLVRDGDLFDFEGDKRSIGQARHGKSGKTPFQGKTFKLKHGDIIYLFSDGVTDQFGGDQHKKFTSKRLKETILKLKDYPLVEQRKLFERTIMEWKGNYTQTDDILLMGLRFSFV
jgi:serine phosphatase RsbU (regulator of sigma subunit)/CheY-like chemotaxis protein